MALARGVGREILMRGVQRGVLFLAGVSGQGHDRAQTSSVCISAPFGILSGSMVVAFRVMNLLELIQPIR
jgi:hypothetical protein